MSFCQYTVPDSLTVQVLRKMTIVTGKPRTVTPIRLPFFTGAYGWPVTCTGITAEAVSTGYSQWTGNRQ